MLGLQQSVGGGGSEKNKAINYVVTQGEKNETLKQYKLNFPGKARYMSESLHTD